MKFGILSTANIGVTALIPAIERSEHELVAIGSRDEARANDVARQFDVPRAYGSYDDLLADDDLDAVYNPLPNSLHAPWTKRAADAGLDVLCEKPLAVDAAEARELADYCDDREVTLMEAFMYRFHPRTERAVEIVESELGELRSMMTSGTFVLDGRPDDVRLDPDLAGGSLMDVGCYAVSAARLFLGEPDRAYGHAIDTRDCGVDTQFVGVLEYDSGATASVGCGFDTPTTHYYRIEGTDGWLRAEQSFWSAPDAAVELTYEVGGRTVTETFDPIDHYCLEVEHFADCIESGRRPRIDGDEAVRNMAVVDALYESARRGESVTVAHDV